MNLEPMGFFGDVAADRVSELPDYDSSLFISKMRWFVRHVLFRWAKAASGNELILELG